MTDKAQMWNLYQTAKTTSSRPSSLIQIDDAWAAYQFDSAVTYIGVAIENAAQEMENVGSNEEPKWKSKYTMRQLLDPNFRLPSHDEQDDFTELQGADGFIFDEVE